MIKIITKNKKFFNSIAKYYDGSFRGWFTKVLIKALKNVNIKENSRILDVGCGTANLLKLLEDMDKNLDLYGIDISEEMLKIANKKLKNSKLKLQSAEEIDFRSNYFDYVFSTEAFHHYADHNKAMKNFHRILKERGTLIIIDLDFGLILNKIFHKIEPGNTKTHSPEEFRKLFESSGFREIKQKRINLFFILTIGKK